MSFTLDIFLLILAAYFIIRGWKRGLTGEAVSLAGFILSFYLSFKFSCELGGIFEETTGLNKYVSQLIAIVAIWVVVRLLSSLLKSCLKKIFSAIHLGGVNKLLGVISGLLRFIVIIYCIIAAGFILMPVCSPVWMQRSEVLCRAGEEWPKVLKLLTDTNLLANANMLPKCTVKETLKSKNK